MAINAAGQSGTASPWAVAAPVSSRNTMMPPVNADGSYTPWNTPTVNSWSLETDPLYRQAIKAGEASFNYARNAALAEKQTAETDYGQQRKTLDKNAAESRRRLAGNYAARGMAGGGSGSVLAQAEGRANAEQIAQRTSITDKIDALNKSFIKTYGDINAEGYDWTGTLLGQQYKTQAAQTALEAALARYGTV